MLGPHSNLLGSLPRHEAEALALAYLDDLRVRAGQLDEALSRGDAGQVRKVAHQIKGSAASYGHPKLGELAGRVDALLRNTDSLNPMQGLGEHADLVVSLIAECRAAAGAGVDPGVEPGMERNQRS